MKPNREELLFQLALTKSAEERAGFLNRECAGDSALRQRLEALLAAHDQSEGVLAESDATAKGTMKVEFAEIPDEAVGQKIGRYKILERVGEGGCGVVYVAEQTEPVRRRVALKVIKLGMDTKQVVARFEAERQALAMMDHPNIAKVLDGGATETGRPYFIMELVRGIKITDYCDQASLPTKERLNLFIQVCHAIQHAHQKGIIHRDIKPSNILVTLNDGVPVPKVIDFGIAKATEGRLTDATVYTQLNQFIGTPAYMSPEQAEMTSLDIDTRSDIYSLGVLLYELLAGSTPFDTQELMSLGIDQMRKAIREREPARPSARLATLQGDELTTTAKRRAIEAPKLIHQLKGDLDWIVMKCLEKDRSRRYETANGLAMDIQRHLNTEPIVARPPSKFYEFQKTVRRHKVGFGATAAIMVTLSVGIAASVWQATRAQHEATMAKSAEQRAVVALDELRAAAPAYAEQARALAEKERFDEAIEKLDNAIKLRPDAADYLVAKGDILECQLKLAEAAALYRAALRVQPDLARAEESAKLCDKLLAMPPSADGKLTHESLAQLLLAMQEQQRPASELMPVARLLGEENKFLLDYWLARLKDLPVSPENPLAKRLTVRDDGRLALDLSGTKVNDLSALRGAPISDLQINDTSVADLTPLHGMPLKALFIYGTKVTNLSPLKGMPLVELRAGGLQITNISVLGGMPLINLHLNDCGPITDVSPLTNCQELENVTLPWNATNIDSLRTLPKLERLGFQEDPKNGYLPDKTVAEFWKDGGFQAVLKSLTESGFKPKYFRQLGDGTWEVHLGGYSKLSDLSALRGLRGAPISDLWIHDTSVADLTPLHGMPLTMLLIFRTKVTDLSPLKGMRLVGLSAFGTGITNISVLGGMPLTSVKLHDCDQITDVSPLTNCQELENVTLPQSATNIDSLRTLPKLERLGFKEDPNNNYLPDKTAAEFWKDYDAKKKAETKQP